MPERNRPNMPEDKIAPINPEAARDQEAEFFGVKAGFDYALGGGEKWTLPNPSYMAPDMKARYLEHLRFMSEDVDFEEKPHPVTGKMTKTQKWPIRKDGKLLNEDELLCVALMGTDVEADRAAYLKDGTVPDTYKKFLAAGGVPGQVQSHWQMMNRQMQERLMRDPK
jgi:hypothetical protein